MPIRADNSKPFGSYYMFGPTKEDNLRYSRDIIVTVAKAGSYKVTEDTNVDGAKAKHYDRIKLTVTNHTKLTLDPGGYEVTAQDGDGEAGRIYDDKVGNNPHSPIRPGHTLHWFLAYGDDSGKLAVSVNPTIPDASGQYDALALGAATWSD